MPIVNTDIKTYYTTKLGSAGFSLIGSADESLGKYVSNTVASAGALGLFDNVSGAENAASDVEYRCLAILNDCASSLTYSNAVVWVSAEEAGGASVAIAVDNAAASSRTSASAQADQVADEGTAPTSVGAFSTPTSRGAGLALGDIPAGYVKMVWIRRTAANTPAKTGDGFTLAVGGDTPA